MNRYLAACGNNTKKAMTLYRYNLLLSRELFTVIGCFEIALRNRIDAHYLGKHGDDWLKKAVDTGGMYMTRSSRIAAGIIQDALRSLGHQYSHSKMVAELGFGFWRYQFANPQFNAAGATLLQIFPGKPTSTPQRQYNNRTIFNELAKINTLRNRIAHHEPICFKPGQPTVNTNYAAQNYALIIKLFHWMRIDEQDLLYGLDHVPKTISKTDNLL